MPAAPKVDTTVPVLMLRSEPCAIHHGSVAIARRLGRLGVPVHALVEDRYTPLAICRYLTAAYVNTTADHAGLLTLVQTIGDEIGAALLLPTDDRSSVFIAEHAQVLGCRYIFPKLPPELPRLLADKASLYALCNRIGVPCPAYAVPTSMDEVDEFVTQAKFPVVLKAAEHSQRLRNGYSGCVVETREELLALIGFETPFRHKVLLQEYIPGEDWIFHGYCNPQTDCFVGFTGRKLRSYPPLAGPTTLGVSMLNDQLSAQVETMLKTIGYSGISDLDYRRDERDGHYKLVDFNPRVGANFRMFEDSAGMDVVLALHLDLTGRAVERARMIEGRTFLVELHDIRAAVSHLRRREMTIGSWIRSLAGKRELAWWSWSDPLPFLAMVARLLVRTGGRGVRTRLRQARAHLHWHSYANQTDR
jgi:predicted ATP-grasp superfamily ATP-dependent carboligase